MTGYIARRLLMMIPTLLGVAILTFFMLRVVPGDVVQVKLMADGGMVSPEAIEAERVRLGLDHSLTVQFLDWMRGIFTLDFGNSMWTGRPVAAEIASRFLVTFQAALMATIIAVFIAVPLGTVSALYRGTVLDYVVRVITIGGLALPGRRRRGVRLRVPPIGRLAPRRGTAYHRAARHDGAPRGG